MPKKNHRSNRVTSSSNYSYPDGHDPLDPENSPDWDGPDGEDREREEELRRLIEEQTKEREADVKWLTIFPEHKSVVSNLDGNRYKTIKAAEVDDGQTMEGTLGHDSDAEFETVSPGIGIESDMLLRSGNDISSEESDRATIQSIFDAHRCVSLQDCIIDYQYDDIDKSDDETLKTFFDECKKAKLTEKQANYAWWNKYVGLPATEIAEAQNVDESTVREHLRAASKKIDRLLRKVRLNPRKNTPDSD